MGDVDVAIVLLDKHVLTYLIAKHLISNAFHDMSMIIPIDEGIIEPEFQDEVPQFLLCLESGVISRLWVRSKHAERIRSLSIHC